MRRPSSSRWQWKRQLLEQGGAVFERHGKPTEVSQSPDSDTLHRKIGELTMERDFLQEKLSPWIEPQGRR